MDYDRRQSRLLDPGMIQTLNAQMEQKTGASPRGSFKAHRKSMVAGNIRSQLRRGTVNINAASFNFMMSSKEMVSHETQTDEAEPKQFDAAETQTDIKETIEAKCQTDRPDQCNSSS